MESTLQGPFSLAFRAAPIRWTTPDRFKYRLFYRELPGGRRMAMCCGGARRSFGHSTTHADRTRAREEVRLVRFTYTGQSTLTVIGSATRRRYRFEGQGATLGVDRRDAHGLSTVPSLRRAMDGE